VACPVPTPSWKVGVVEAAPSLVLAVKVPVMIVAPAANVPVVDKFSSPKLIAPVSELMVAVFIMAEPVVEAVPAKVVAPPTDKVLESVVAAAANVPVVLRFSSAKLIAPVVEFMVATLKAPVEEALMKESVPVTPRVPPMVVLPLVSSTINLLVSMTMPFTVEVAVTLKVLLRVAAPVAVNVPPVFMLLPMVVAAPTIPAVASVATIEAIIT